MYSVLSCRCTMYILYHICRGRGVLRAYGATPSDTHWREAVRREPWIGGSVLCPCRCRCAWAAPLPSTPSPAHLPPPASPTPNPNPRVSRCRPPLVAFLCPSPSSPATGRRPLPGSPTSRPPPPLRPPPAGDPTGGVPVADGFAQPSDSTHMLISLTPSTQTDPDAPCCGR